MTASRTTVEPFRDLIEQSLEEAAFCWKRWEADLDSLTRNLDEVWSWTEDRLHGALDGVRVAGDQIIGITHEALQGRDLAAVTVAAHLLASQSPPAARAALGEAVRQAGGERLRAIARGIETAGLDGSFAPVTAVLADGAPEHAAALCRIKAFHRSAPGRELLVALEADEPRVQADALRSMACTADETHARRIDRSLASASAEVRTAAMCAGIRRRVPAAWDAAVESARRRETQCGPVLALLAALGTPEEQQLVISALREPALQRAGLSALAYIGTPEAVEICLAGMRDAQLARCAGEAYCAITGSDLQRDGLAAPESPDGPSPPPFEEDTLDADLVPAPADLWPLPELDAVRRHWLRIRTRYAAGVRHWRGQPVDVGVLLDAVESGPMIRRGDLARELAVRTSGRYDFEPRAFRHLQRRAMQASRARLALPAPR